jgi:spore maturation protein CgeB
MSRPLDIVFLGLSLSSSWGNGHATTFRALLRGLAAHGHRLSFLERDVPWYAEHRDLPAPDFCELAYYRDLRELRVNYGERLKRADTVVVGSYVPEGVAVIDMLATLSLQQLCFYDIDTPVTLANLERGDEEYIARRQIPIFDIYFSFSGGAVLERLRSEFAAREAAELYCSVDSNRYRNTGEPMHWDLGYLGTYSADRQPMLDRLLIEPAWRLPEMRFVVAGPQYPASIQWPPNVDRIEHLPPVEHASFYSRQRYTLNVTRSDMIAAGWSPSVRLFEAAACGTAIISDRWRGLEELFPDRLALIIADNSDEVIRVLGKFSDTERQALAAEARRRVMRDHTGSARATQFIEALAQNKTSRLKTRAETVTAA